MKQVNTMKNSLPEKKISKSFDEKIEDWKASPKHTIISAKQLLARQRNFRKQIVIRRSKSLSFYDRGLSENERLKLKVLHAFQEFITRSIIKNWDSESEKLGLKIKKKMKTFDVFEPGDKVMYKNEFGIVKSVKDDSAFVVYMKEEDTEAIENYKNRTGASTKLKDLSHGWCNHEYVTIKDEIGFTYSHCIKCDKLKMNE